MPNLPLAMVAPSAAQDPLAAAYAELRTSLLAYLRKQVGDAQVAEDLLHEVMVKALTAASDAEHAPRQLTGWLYGVARNTAMDYHRRRRPTDVLSDEMLESLPQESSDDAQAAIEQLAHCLRPMAERLPETYRDTVLAAELDGLSLGDVAQALGLSLVATRQRASRGRRLLQEELVRCCRVALSSGGAVTDYDPAAAAQCQPQAPTCTPCSPRRPH